MSSKDLNEIKELIVKLLSRLESLEKKIENTRKEEEAEMLKLIVRILEFGLSPVDLADKSLKILKAKDLAKKYKDEITRAIIDIVTFKGPINISELTREVRKYRGKASRRVIRDRLEKLKREGMITLRKKGREKVVNLEID